MNRIHLAGFGAMLAAFVLLAPAFVQAVDSTGATAIDDGITSALPAPLRQALMAQPAGDITDEDRASLLFTVEEEKMARSVYLHLYDKWGLRPFHNIATRGETHHLAAARAVIARHGLPDITEGRAANEFADTRIQAIHDRLIREGEASLEGAIRAGLWIEDHDIADLQARLAATQNSGLKVLYQNLIKGSRNHLRAFARQASMRGIAYEPGALSRADFDAITASPHETGQCITDPEAGNASCPAPAPGLNSESSPAPPSRESGQGHGQGRGRMRRGQR